MLPDGVTHMRGFVKDPNEAKRYMSLDDEALLQADKEDEMDLDMRERCDRRTIDLSKNVLASATFKTVSCLSSILD